MFDTWSLRTKLISAFCSCAAILAVVGTVSYVRLNEVIEKYDRVVSQNLPNMVNLGEINDVARRFNIMIAAVQGAAVTAAELKVHEENLAKAIQDMEEASKAYLETPFAPGEEPLWDRVDEGIKNITAYSKKILEMSSATDPESLKRRDEYAANYESVRRPFRDSFTKLYEFQEKEVAKWSGEAKESGVTTSTIVLSLVVAGVLMAFFLGFFISASLTNTMNRVAQQLSSGADEVTSAATEISATSEQLSASATEQASSLQETASSIEEMSSMVKQNSDSAGRSSEVARTGSATATRGKQVVEEMIGAINDIDGANREISDVVKVIGQIGSKTKIIDDIVFKTQLLSFNASVEAARAGEHGKGFAVVAEEVGNLAQMSGNAAREISEMLEQSLGRVERMIATSRQKVEVGMNIGKRCGEVLDDLVTSVNDVNTMANEIAGACQEQSRGISEITRAMTQLDQVTQQNASASQQSASAAEQLSQQAETLRASVGELMHLISGSAQMNAGYAPAQAVRSKRAAAPMATKKIAKLDEARQRRHDGQKSGVPSGKHEGFDDVA